MRLRRTPPTVMKTKPYLSALVLIVSFQIVCAQTPKTAEDIAALAAYAKDVGKYDQVFKAGSAQVNSFYKEELEAAKERGADDFSIPGLNEVTIEQTLSFRSV